ncbi:hypothetical protein [Solicola gregarius]|uniref:Uncharacterized protein n=1 Tax=Solicola gregarius TaxID=2908642 RepID=A0AA46YKS0_9ACTN|nr:hypothetical protein [Solicola gregarius]UYM05787.1 hypothetical protein L0C25_01530 [Solicola gregarius]
MTHELPRTPDVRAIYLVLTASALDLDESGEVDVRPFADDSRALPPPDLLVARGSTVDDLEGLADRPHVLAVTKASGLAEAHDVECAARSRALRIAAEHDGIVIDTAVPWILHGDASHSPAAHEWFAFSHTGTSIRTHGLARFGLPELGNDQADAERLPMYDAVLVGVAQRLIEEWPANDPIGPATITLRDIARGYGDAFTEGDDPTLTRSVDVSLRYDRGNRLLEAALHDDPAVELFGG